MRCNDSEDKGAGNQRDSRASSKGTKKREQPKRQKKDDWHDLMDEGWAMRKPRKNKKR